MKKILLLLITSFILFVSCGGPAELEDISIAVSFESETASRAVEYLEYTPKAYSIGLKKATLIGSGDTDNFILFEHADITDSSKFSFTSANNSAQSILATGNTIPVGEYESIEFELYYLQMTLDVYLTDGSQVDRNMRIYFSDDAELAGGLHQPGDVTVVDESGVESGWLMGNAYDDFTGMTPRESAYANSGVWMDFAGKDAADYGPFGDAAWWEAADQPVYKETIAFDFDLRNARAVLVDFNVAGTWNCDDVNADGHFNPDDAVQRWHMDLPEMTAKINN